jgi:hypothetical protein
MGEEGEAKEDATGRAEGGRRLVLASMTGAESEVLRWAARKETNEMKGESLRRKREGLADGLDPPRPPRLGFGL